MGNKYAFSRDILVVCISGTPPFFRESRPHSSEGGFLTPPKGNTRREKTCERVVNMSELTTKQERFVNEYIKDLNATQAAIRAGYSAKTAGVQGSVLLKNPNVSAEVKKRLADIKSDSIADATEVLEYFTRVMRREETEKVVVTLKEETSTWELGDDGKYRKNTVKGERVEVVEIDAKLSDANTAAIQLAKRYGLINGETEKVNDGVLNEIISAVKGVTND